MPEKFNLKIYGVSDPSDVKLMEENLRSQDGVKSLKFLLSKNQVEIKAEIDTREITKQQFRDIIRLSGDLKIEEEKTEEEKAAVAEPAAKKEKKKLPPQQNEIESSDGRRTFNADDVISRLNPGRRLFGEGFLVGSLIISLILNITLGALLLKGTSSIFPTKQAWAINANNNAAAPVGNQQQPKAAKPSAAAQQFDITKSDHVRGDFNAPITLVEYSDFECPYCEKHYPTLKKILADYKGKVRLVYKHFPLSFHQNSQKAAEASECASEQGKFWEYHDKLFENQGSGYSVGKFRQWASDLDLNTSKFNNCLDSSKYADKISADEADGQQRGVDGTPATFVNGQLISGALPYESFKSAIDQILGNN